MLREDLAKERRGLNVFPLMCLVKAQVVLADQGVWMLFSEHALAEFQRLGVEFCRSLKLPLPSE